MGIKQGLPCARSSGQMDTRVCPQQHDPPELTARLIDQSIDCLCRRNADVCM